MKIILKKEVANLGEAGDVVEVKAGYAQNYLIPQGYAVMGTPSALKQHAETLRQRAHKEAKLVADAEALAAKLAAVPVKVSAKVTEAGKLFGSVGANAVVEALAAAGYEVEKRFVDVPEIKEPGEYEAKVKLYKNVFANLKVEVVPEQ